MRKVIVLVFILFFAGCKTTENLKEMPVAQVVSQRAETMSPMEELPVIQMVEKVKEREKFYSLSVRDMALRNVLFMFSKELPEYNMVIDPDVAGVATLNFTDLPLDKALEIILEPLGLEHTIEDNILRVSNPRMITRTFEFVYSTTTRVATSSLLASTGGEGGGSGSISTSETIDVWAEMESGIRDLLSETGKLSISKRIGRISVTDYRSNMKEIASFIDVFRRDTKKQILIRAKILEVELKKEYEYGVDWNLALKGIKLLSTKANPFRVGQSFAPAAGIEITVVHSDLDFVIRALETQGKVTALSTPEISTLNGQKAIILSVTEDVVFESSQSAGSGGDPIVSTTATPFSYGVYLDVTPHVDSEGMITMDIHPSISIFKRIATSPDGNAQQPIIDTREVETVATVRDGETVIIAGLLKDTFSKEIRKFPILGDIPYLGKAFRSEKITKSKTEIVILITPTIVGPRAKDFGTVRAKYKNIKSQFFH